MADFGVLLREHYGDRFSAEQLQLVERFRDLVLAENEVQNLTRITEPLDFVEGHVADAVALLDSGFLGASNLDLGSGCGVPGAVCAILAPEQQWILAESEIRKAEFLTKLQTELDLTNCMPIHSRGEAILEEEEVDAVVARAVGPVDRIYAWLRDCSTWNTLVLLKGPGWDEEWQKASRTFAGKELAISRKFSYTVGKTDERRRERQIVELNRKKKPTSR